MWRLGRALGTYRGCLAGCWSQHVSNNFRAHLVANTTDVGSIEQYQCDVLKPTWVPETTKRVEHISACVQNICLFIEQCFRNLDGFSICLSGVH